MNIFFTHTLYSHYYKKYTFLFHFVTGLYIEGAAWMHDEEECEDYDVNGVVCRGHLVDAELKELLPSIPVVYIRAVAVDPSWGKFLI